MKSYIVYVNGVEMGIIQAGSHNSAEKKAQRQYGPSPEKIRSYIRVNPWMSEANAKVRLESAVSVAYTEI